MARPGVVTIPEFASHRQVRPTSVEELAACVRDAGVVSTYNSFQDSVAVPGNVRDRIRLDHILYAEQARLLPWLHSDGSEFGAEYEEQTARHRHAHEAERNSLVESAGSVQIPGLVHIGSSELPSEVEVKAEDQVVIVRGPVPWLRLNRELQAVGQCLPHPAFVDTGIRCPVVIAGDTPAAAIDVNFPHFLEAQCGSWRDWILGLTVVLADGTIAKSGSQAVKNVAGYDLQKLFLGARGTLGIIVEVILRTYPLAAVPRPAVELGPLGRSVEEHLSGTSSGDTGKAAILGPKWVQRVLPSDLRAAIQAAGDRLLMADHASSTLWAVVPPEEELPRFAGDWVLRSGAGAKNLEITDPTQVRFMQRTKELFDPTHKLNPGEMGIF